MEFLSNADFWIGLVKIVWINIILSGDNAVVIALAARSLPPAQQKKAIMFGSGAAVVLRIVLTVLRKTRLRRTRVGCVRAYRARQRIGRGGAERQTGGDGCEYLHQHRKHDDRKKSSQPPAHDPLAFRAGNYHGGVCLSRRCPGRERLMPPPCGILRRRSCKHRRTTCTPPHPGISRIPSGNPCTSARRPCPGPERGAS